METTNSLLKIFESSLNNYNPDLPIDNINELLKTELKNKKYDVQDQAIIEAILKQEKQTLEDSFLENLDKRFQTIKSTDLKKEFAMSDQEQEEIVNIYIATLEHLINYFYTGLLSKHFASS